VRVEDPRWRGYLANVTPEEFDQYASRIPERMRGAEFLAQYGGTTDPVTRVDPGATYGVRVPARHPVAEHARVTEWRDRLVALGDSDENPDIVGPALGRLMYESHASYSACGLGSSGTDDVVALAREVGPARGVYGAKITGGGSGGTVALLTRAEAAATVEEIVARYADRSRRATYVFSGSSPGAAASGTRRVKLYA
jgi:L-arabinokinase